MRHAEGAQVFRLLTRSRAVIPKVHSAEDVVKIHEMIEKHAHREAKDSIKLIASIESAKAIMNLKEVSPIRSDARRPS